MALVDCPECGTQVSSAAPSCPNCGYPVAQQAGPAEGARPKPDLAEARVEKPKRPTWRRIASMVPPALLALGVGYVLLVLTLNRCNEGSPETVEPGSQSRGWTQAGKGLSAVPLEPESQSRGRAEGGNRPSSKVGAVPVSAQGSITNPEHTLGESRATILRLCERDDGTWIDGMCMLSRDMAVMFEWRNARVMEHTIMKEDTSFGHSMVREFRKLGGKEDSTVAADGCDEYIWRNIGGRRYWVIICPSRGIATASARRL